METFQTFLDVLLSAHRVSQAIAAVITVLFLFFLKLLAKSNSALGNSLNAAISALSRFPRNSGGVPQTKQEIEDRLVNDPLLRHAWHEYAETLVLEGKTGEQQWRSTREAADFFSHDALTHSATSAFGLKHGVFDSIPALLTGLGLLGTFLGLIVGLPAELKQVEEIAKKIPEFMSGMRGAFLSSVFGVGLGLLFNFVEKASSDRQQGKCQRLSDCIDGLFLRRPEHYFLGEIARLGDDQLGELKLLAVQIGNEVVRGITGSAAENLKIDENVRDGIAKGFSVLAGSLVEFTEFQKSYFESLKEAQALQQNILQSYKELQAVSENAVISVKSTAESVQSLSGELRSTSEMFSQATKDVGSVVTKQQEATDSLSKVAQNLGSSSSDLINRQAAFLTAFDQVVKSFASSNSNLNSQMATYHESLNKCLSEDFKAFDAGLAGGIDKFNSALGMLNSFVDGLNQSVSQLRSALPPKAPALPQPVLNEE